MKRLAQVNPAPVKSETEKRESQLQNKRDPLNHVARLATRLKMGNPNPRTKEAKYT